MRLIVFTDLDGTLLDHASYSHAAADPALKALSDRDIPLILASSKTAAEIAPLHRDLGLGDLPMIVENGAARVDPSAGVEADRSAYLRLRAALDALPQILRHPYTGFGDLSDDEVAEITGLSPDNAALARKRAYTEPGLWSGDEPTLERFLAALSESGIIARRGGRFLTLSFGGTKAGQMQTIMQALGRDTAIALGDAPNDVEMIEQAAYGVIVRNDHGADIPPLPGEKTGRIRRTSQPGPLGWNAAVLEILQQTADPRTHS